MFNLVTGDDSIFYLNGWEEWHWRIGMFWCPLVCFLWPGVWTTLDPAPDSSARTRNHSAEWMELDTVLSNAETGSISRGYGHGVIDPGSGSWILIIRFLYFTGLTSCHLKLQYFAFIELKHTSKTIDGVQSPWLRFVRGIHISNWKKVD